MLCSHLSTCHAHTPRLNRTLAPQVRAEKDALAKKLKAMEGKILKGEARGGLVEVTRKKEAELKRKEEELERRWAVVWPEHCGAVVHLPGPLSSS